VAEDAVANVNGRDALGTNALAHAERATRQRAINESEVFIVCIVSMEEVVKEAQV